MYIYIRNYQKTTIFINKFYGKPRKSVILGVRINFKKINSEGRLYEIKSSFMY